MFFVMPEDIYFLIDQSSDTRQACLKFLLLIVSYRNFLNMIRNVYV